MVVQPTPAVAADLAGPPPRQVLVLDPFSRSWDVRLGGEGSTRSHAVGSLILGSLNE